MLFRGNALIKLFVLHSSYFSHLLAVLSVIVHFSQYRTMIGNSQNETPQNTPFYTLNGTLANNEIYERLKTCFCWLVYSWNGVHILVYIWLYDTTYKEYFSRGLTFLWNDLMDLYVFIEGSWSSLQVTVNKTKTLISWSLICSGLNKYIISLQGNTGIEQCVVIIYDHIQWEGTKISTLLFCYK